MGMLRQHGAEIIFQEKMTVTKRDRLELNKLLFHMAPGDTVIVESLSRLGRSTKALIELVELMSEKEVQFERDVIAEHTRDGLDAARAKGRNGGRPRYDQHKLPQALKLYKAGKHSIAG